MSRRRKIIYWIVGIFVGLTVLGSIVGPTPEPEVRTVYRTKTITKVVTETVKVPHLSEDCARALELGTVVGKAATSVADVTNPQLDIMHRAGKQIIKSDQQALTESANEQRDLETKISEQSRSLFNTLPEYRRAVSACKEASQ